MGLPPQNDQGIPLLFLPSGATPPGFLPFPLSHSLKISMGVSIPTLWTWSKSGPPPCPFCTATHNQGPIHEAHPSFLQVTPQNRGLSFWLNTEERHRRVPVPFGFPLTRISVRPRLRTRLDLGELRVQVATFAAGGRQVTELDGRASRRECWWNEPVLVGVPNEGNHEMDVFFLFCFLGSLYSPFPC